MDFLPVTYENVNSFLKLKAEDELNEDEIAVKSEIDDLKKLIQRKF